MSGEITGEYIKSAVSNKIAINIDRKEYLAIYKEKQEQNLQRPCFFVLELNTTQDKEMNDNFTRSYLINVRYHPQSSERCKYEKCAEIGNLLSYHLTEINEADGMIRGSNIKYEIVDEILHFSVTYKVRIRKEAEPVVKQQTLESKERVKK